MPCVLQTCRVAFCSDHFDEKSGLCLTHLEQVNKDKITRCGAHAHRSHAPSARADARRGARSVTKSSSVEEVARERPPSACPQRVTICTRGCGTRAQVGGVGGEAMRLNLSELQGDVLVVQVVQARPASAC